MKCYKLHKVLIESLTFSHNELYLSSLGGVEDKVVYLTEEHDYCLGFADRKIALRISFRSSQNRPHFKILPQ